MTESIEETVIAAEQSDQSKKQSPHGVLETDDSNEPKEEGLTAVAESDSFSAHVSTRHTSSNDTSTPPTDVALYQRANYLGAKPSIIWPPLAKKKRLRGEVVLRGFVTEDGTLTQLALLQSSGHSLLDNSALDQATKWVFQATLIDGKPVGSWVKIPIVFQ
jgi:protein TonB